MHSNPVSTLRPDLNLTGDIRSVLRRDTYSHSPPPKCLGTGDL